MKKIISILACVCLLLSVMIVPVSATENSATISFADKAYRTGYSKAEQVWEQNGIKLTNTSSTNNVGDYANPGRFYKNTHVLIEYSGMTKIDIDVANMESKYQNAWVNSCTVGTAELLDNIVTITLDAPADSYEITLTDNQARANSITVYAGGSAEDDVCTHEDRIYESNGDETHAVVCASCGETISTADCKDIDLDGVCDTCTGEVALPETLTIAEAVALGAEKEHNTYTADKYFVTGQITAIASTTYGNMHIADEEGNSIYIYGLYSNDGTVRYDALEAKPDEGDTIKVLSTVGNYNGAQLKNAWLIEFTAGELEPTTPDPEADTALTIEEAIALGESKMSNVFTENKYYVTGTVTEIYNEAYGNMYIADENGNILTIYGTYSADGSIGYAEMETKPVVGDTVTVYGVIGQYNGKAQIKNGWITEIVPDVQEPVNPGVFTVSDAEAVTGKEFTVTIDISNNPGIINAGLEVNYDANVLELVKAEDGDFATAEPGGDDLANYNYGPVANNPFRITWAAPIAEENITANGTFVTLTFKVKADAAEGTTDISVTPLADDILDVAVNDVAFIAESGTVNITVDNGLPGDANGDGRVNSRDVVLITQYNNGWEVEIDLDNADVNDDGRANSRDVVLIVQYNNGWEVELK